MNPYSRKAHVGSFPHPLFLFGFGPFLSRLCFSYAFLDPPLLFVISSSLLAFWFPLCLSSWNPCFASEAGFMRRSRHHHLTL